MSAVTATRETTTVAARTAVTTAITTTIRILFAWARFVHLDGAAAKIGAINALDGFLCGAIVSHCDERKTAGFACELIFGDKHFFDGTELTECRAQLVFRHIERKVTNIQFLTHN